MAIAPVLKTGVRKGMGVRIPRSPSLPAFHVITVPTIQPFANSVISTWVTFGGRFRHQNSAVSGQQPISSWAEKQDGNIAD